MMKFCSLHKLDLFWSIAFNSYKFLTYIHKLQEFITHFLRWMSDLMSMYFLVFAQSKVTKITQRVLERIWIKIQWLPKGSKPLLHIWKQQKCYKCKAFLVFYILTTKVSDFNQLFSIQNILQWDGQSFSFVEPLIDPQLETFVQISSKCWLFFLWLQGP